APYPDDELRAGYAYGLDLLSLHRERREYFERGSPLPAGNHRATEGCRRLDSSTGRARRRRIDLSGLSRETQGGGEMIKYAGLFSLAIASAFAQDIHVLPVQGNVYMLVGAGGNIAP